eukprot:gene4239-6016_t
MNAESLEEGSIANSEQQNKEQNAAVNKTKKLTLSAVKKSRLLGSIYSLFPGRKLTEEEEAKKEIDLIIKKQQKIMKTEIIQSWRIVFGKEVPKKKKDTFLIHDVSYRNIWMEPNYVFQQIKNLRLDQVFHPLDNYILTWQPIDSAFQLSILLDDPKSQENAIKQIAKMRKRERKKLLFFFAPKDNKMTMFAENVHPSSLLSYRTKNEVLKKLCDLFLDNKIDINDIQQIFLCGQDVWSSAVYNLLPPDEQIYHTYLNERISLDTLTTQREISKSYLEDEITLQEYDDLKFPERKKMREIEESNYPLPYVAEKCIICSKENAGVIKCQNCTNMACVACIQAKFIDKEDGDGSFLLMHHRYCLKLGKLKEVVPIIVMEPGYLREFRKTSRIAALQYFAPKVKDTIVREIKVLDDIEPETEEEKAYFAELERIKAEEQLRRRMRENPDSLINLQNLFNERKKRFDKLRKDILEYQEKINEGAEHTEQFLERIVRLKTERIEKLVKNVSIPVETIRKEAMELNLTGKYIDSLLDDIASTLKETKQLCNLPNSL